ncbi:MAG: histidine kinase [Halieaceae bacterium]|jgi:signal transduction histidine kinase|nr:histidine kinase [Halieaceae bacterium]
MTLEKFFDDRRVQFWSLQLIGWTGWGVTFYVAAVLWGSPSSYARYVPVITLVGLIISLGMRAIYRATWNWTAWHRVLVVLVVSYLAGVTWKLSRFSIFRQMFDVASDKEARMMAILQTPTDHLFYRLENVTSAWMVMLCWTGLYFGIKYYHLLQEERARGLKTEAMAHEAQLKMLRYQLNPHFLFNTLNAISTLVLDKQNQMANTMLTRLSHFLRYSLDNDPMAKVSLAQELEAMRLYLDIEKVRFDERLKLEFDIEPAAERALIPSLLLQPLVENAIKYAIARSIGGGTLRIAASVSGDALQLEVADNGPGIDAEQWANPRRHGVGLVNTRERLAELYGKRHDFELASSDPHGLTVRIRIPLELQAAAEKAEAA